MGGRKALNHLFESSQKEEKYNGKAFVFVGSGGEYGQMGEEADNGPGKFEGSEWYRGGRQRGEWGEGCRKGGKKTAEWRHALGHFAGNVREGLHNSTHNI